MTGSAEVVAPGSPYFALHTLGWRAFQDLCAAILRQVWGQTFTAFADSNDGGRDGAFYGIWAHIEGRSFDAIPAGPFVTQCKHSKNPGATLPPSMLDDELAKVDRLVKKGLCKTYVLLTNARVTGASEEKIRERLAGAGVAYSFVLDGQWISDTIARSRELRMFVPRVYGLGDLSQILDERSYTQASVILAAASEEVASFVVTSAYRKAAEALRDHGFVMLLGEPGVGKSAIARMLAVGAADNWSSMLIKARTSEELVQRWNPHEKNQLFWIDDAFGVVKYEERLATDWARDLPHVMSAIKCGAKVVLTSRSYIYSDARPMLKSYAYPLLAEQQVAVEVADISRSERHQILYNHIAAGDQPVEVRKLMKPHLEDAAEADAFRPETARRLGLQAFTSGLTLDRAGIVAYVARPQQFLSDVFSQLDSSAQSALSLVYCAGSEGLSICFTFSATRQAVVEAAGSTPGACIGSISSLVGTFLRREGQAQGEAYHFRHPTLREGFATWLSEKPHLVSAMLAGMDNEALLDSTDCLPPDAEPVQGTLMRIPSALFRPVAERFLAIFDEWPGGSCWTGSICRYMARRASDDFLRTYLTVDPSFNDKLLDFGSFADFVPEPTILARLSKMGELSERSRRSACTQMVRLSRTFLDPALLNEGPWQTLLRADERELFLEFVRSEIVPRLEQAVREDWPGKAIWKADEDGDGVGLDDPLGYALGVFREAFDREGDNATSEAFADAIELNRQRIGTLSVDAESISHPEPSASAEFLNPSNAGRSVFSDIDELP